MAPRTISLPSLAIVIVYIYSKMSVFMLSTSDYGSKELCEKYVNKLMAV